MADLCLRKCAPRRGPAGRDRLCLLCGHRLAAARCGPRSRGAQQWHGSEDPRVKREIGATRQVGGWLGRFGIVAAAAAADICFLFFASRRPSLNRVETTWRPSINCFALGCSSSFFHGAPALPALFPHGQLLHNQVHNDFSIILIRFLSPSQCIYGIKTDCKTISKLWNAQARSLVCSGVVHATHHTPCDLDHLVAVGNLDPRPTLLQAACTLCGVDARPAVSRHHTP